MWRVSVGLDGNVGQTRAPGRAGVAVDGSMDDTSLLSLTVEIQSDGCGCVDAAELRAQLITRQDSLQAGPTLPRFRLGLWRWDANGGGLKAPAMPRTAAKPGKATRDDLTRSPAVSARLFRRLLPAAEKVGFGAAAGDVPIDAGRSVPSCSSTENRAARSRSILLPPGFRDQARSVLLRPARRKALRRDNNLQAPSPRRDSTTYVHPTICFVWIAASSASSKKLLSR
jgi:hypothetical protein